MISLSGIWTKVIAGLGFIAALMAAWFRGSYHKSKRREAEAEVNAHEQAEEAEDAGEAAAKEVQDEADSGSDDPRDHFGRGRL